MSTLAVSQIERHFITNEIYKRSKRYFDVIKLKSIESIDSKLRRVPIQTPKQQIEHQIENSFMNSEQFYCKKRTQQIEKSKSKNSHFQTFDDLDQTQTNYSVATKHRHASSLKRAFDMSKSLPRDFYQNINHSSVNEPFDNFSSSDFSKGQKGKSIDFNKILGRNDFTRYPNHDSRNKQINSHLNKENLTKQNTKNPEKQQTKDISKVYEKLYFDSSKFRCLIDVEKERKADQRKSLKTNLENYQSKQISLQKIDKARAVSQKNQNPCGLMFYHGRGKEQPSLLDNRMLKKNENYWAEQLKIMKKQDFETVKRREEMIQKRMSEITQRKKIPDVRGQICDTRFFLRNKK